MKVLVRYCQQWGNFSTKALEICDDDTIESFERKVSEKFLIKNQKFMLKLKRDGFNVRICSSFPLSFYNLEEKSILLLEIIENSSSGQQLSEKRINQKYFDKLGILDSVTETYEVEEEDFNEDLFNESLCFNKSQSCSPEKEPETHSFVKDNSIIFQRKYSVPNMAFESGKSENYRLIQAAKNGNVSTVKDMLENSKDITIDESGKCGWNALHYAIFQRNEEVALFLINKGANLDLKTIDGWSPLQLSIYRNQTTVFNKILRSKMVDLNLMTKRGTALHLACRIGKPIFVKALIEAGCDCDSKNVDGYRPVDLTSNEEVIGLFKAKFEQELKKKNDSKNVSQIDFYDISSPDNKKVVEKPPIVKGEMFKISNIGFTLNTRFFVLNAEEGTLIRFKSRDEFPLKPKEILPLKDLELIKKIEKPWYIRKDLFFFEIKYAGKSQTLACKYKSTMKLWIKNIYQAAVYTIQMETFLLKLNKQNLNDNVISLMQKCFTLSNNASLELLDDPKDDDVLLNKNLLFLESEHTSQKDNTVSTKSTTDNEQEKITFKSFQIVKLLGSGAFGKVYLARKKSTNELYALKVIRKRQIVNRNQVKYAIAEVNILKKMNHPFIINLYFSFQTPQNLYMALDYCPAKDLALHLANHGLFSKEIAKFYISEIILAIEYLHSMDIIYRDLKPENILLDQDGHVKLADFGLSKEGIISNNSTMSFCGSPVYLCPEMLKHQGYSKKSDIYGIGLVLYEMLTGNPPFYSDDIQVMYRMIMTGKLSYPKDMSKDAKSLLENLLQKHPENRFTIKEIKEHEFFRGLDWEGVLKKEYQSPKIDFEDYGSLKVDKHLNYSDEDYTEANYANGRFPNYSFVYESAQTTQTLQE